MTLPTLPHDDIDRDPLDTRARRVASELSEAEREVRIALLRLEMAKIRLKRVLSATA